MKKIQVKVNNVIYNIPRSSFSKLKNETKCAFLYQVRTRGVLFFEVLSYSSGNKKGKIPFMNGCYFEIGKIENFQFVKTQLK